MTNKVLCILGMHRSGTSLIAHWLQKSGLHIGDNLVGPGIGNEDGHFEDIDFLELNMQILRLHSLPDTGFGETLVEKLSDYEWGKMKMLIRLKNALYNQWGWKEPRTCVLLRFYRELIPSAKYIIIFRDHNEVVHSLIRRDYKIFEERYINKRKITGKFSLYFGKKRKLFELLYKDKAEKYLRAWITFNKELIKHIQCIGTENSAVINYNDLLQSAEQIFSHVRSEWGFQLKYKSIDEIYKSDMMHSNTETIKQYIHDQSLQNIAAQVQSTLCGFCNNLKLKV